MVTGRSWPVIERDCSRTTEPVFGLLEDIHALSTSLVSKPSYSAASTSQLETQFLRVAHRTNAGHSLHCKIKKKDLRRTSPSVAEEER
ncbi:uncharacterized protein BJ212DRAFT_1321792, partial [Suillus subaureus]